MKNYIKQIVFGLSMVMTYQQNYGQNWQWANHGGGAMRDIVSCSTDEFGNYYVAGLTESSKCYFNNDTIISNGYSDVFVAKYDKNGVELWVNGYGGNDPMGCGEVTFKPVFDSSYTYYYIVGSFCGTIQLGSISLSTSIQSIFLAKFDLNGNCIWAKQNSGGGTSFSAGLAIDAMSNIYICGFNNSPISFDGKIANPGVFLAKFDTLGTCMWARGTFGYSGWNPDAYPAGLKAYGSNIIMGGHQVNDTLIVDTVTEIVPLNYYASMLACFDTSGYAKWIRTMAGPTSEGNYDVACDENGNIFTTGYYVDSAIFGTTILYNSTKHDYFLAKYGIDGHFKWARQGMADKGEGINVVADHNGGVYCTGWFEGNATFGNYSVTSSSPRDAFIARYDSIGNCIGVVHFGQAEGWGLCLDSVGDICVSGTFENTINFGSQTFTSNGLEDFFIAKLDAITGINQLPAPINQLLIYANPTQGKCNITIPDDMANEAQLTLTVYDNMGRVIQERTVYLTDNKIKLNLSAEAKGMYHVALSSGNKRYTGKIIFE